MKRGLVLFAHGARDPRWAEPFEAVVDRARAQQPTWIVQLAFLELMTPTLFEAGNALAAAGCTRVDIVPLFLGSGGHVRKDLPALMDTLRSAHPEVRWHLLRAVGEQPNVIAAMAEAATFQLNDDPLQ